MGKSHKQPTILMALIKLKHSRELIVFEESINVYQSKESPFSLIVLCSTKDFNMTYQVHPYKLVVPNGVPIYTMREKCHKLHKELN
jgi:hypothetical protein